MSWSEYQPPTATIVIGTRSDGTEMTGQVRGLCLEDLTAILTNHHEAVVKAAALFAQAVESKFSTTARSKLVVLLAQEFPTLVKEVMALGTGEPKLRTTPVALGVQITALNEILRLTLDEVGGLGNLLLALRSAVPNLRAALTGDEAAPVNGNPSPNSTGA